MSYNNYSDIKSFEVISYICILNYVRDNIDRISNPNKLIIPIDMIDYLANNISSHDHTIYLQDLITMKNEINYYDTVISGILITLVTGSACIYSCYSIYKAITEHYC